MTMLLSRRALLSGIGSSIIVSACAATPRVTMPVDAGATAMPDLVNLARYDPRLRFDIRYATRDNFMRRVLYPVARAVAQRPAADALKRVQDRAEAAGYGLLIHDAYRPWRITRMMWDETPEAQREFVANPATGSRHNRGCAIDLSLHRRGVPVSMPSPYDDFTPAAYRSYMGGTAVQNANRARLEEWMAAEGFIPLPNEWWHFDWRDWRSYPIMDTPLEAI
jgi:zinc D-Ala-D-Ala dipeptidase